MTIPVAGSQYPCGPCGMPVECPNCGTIITEENVVKKDCDEECEICDYCGNEKCPQLSYTPALWWVYLNSTKEMHS